MPIVINEVDYDQNGTDSASFADNATNQGEVMPRASWKMSWWRMLFVNWELNSHDDFDPGRS
jgi:hypothetical protein